MTEPSEDLVEKVARKIDPGAGWTKAWDHPLGAHASKTRMDAARANARDIIALVREADGFVGRSASFQARVEPWMRECFGDVIPFDKIERADRFIEEAVELAQTTRGFTRDRAHALVDYVFSRAVGEPAQEVGGVMVTLAAYCLANGLDMAAAGETELARIWTKVPQIRAKQAAKPTGSALPIAQPPSDNSQQEDAQP